MHARLMFGCSDLPGYGRVRWTAETLLVPDGTVFAVVLQAAFTDAGAPLAQAGRDELVFWESMTADATSGQ